MYTVYNQSTNTHTNARWKDNCDPKYEPHRIFKQEASNLRQTTFSKVHWTISRVIKMHLPPAFRITISLKIKHEKNKLLHDVWTGINQNFQLHEISRKVAYHRKFQQTSKCFI
jgi:hypothetical protein